MYTGVYKNRLYSVDVLYINFLSKTCCPLGMHQSIGRYSPCWLPSAYRHLVGDIYSWQWPMCICCAASILHSTLTLSQLGDHVDSWDGFYLERYWILIKIFDRYSRCGDLKMPLPVSPECLEVSTCPRDGLSATCRAVSTCPGDGASERSCRAAALLIYCLANNAPQKARY